MCLINRSLNGSNEPEGQETHSGKVMKRLIKFTSKHRVNLVEIAVQALELWTDPTRSHDYVLVIYLRTREGSTKPEKYFYATEAEVVPVDALAGFPPGRERTIRESIKAETERVKPFGMAGSLLMILMSWDVQLGGMTMNQAPAGFASDMLASSGTPWKESLFLFLNNGILT
ncbi:hypothetical protein NLI96_g5174 [Meripilus lineatus]|uniref:Uncharacterized protein n=1 Tax=Meripilus lineatus TaxID=2056292 RepID=A0AAD5V3G5_9APHY|nr:hypothetical protein NLI96_g5174 [Physisporinus lineatus]